MKGEPEKVNYEKMLNEHTVVLQHAASLVRSLFLLL
jgi:hypothetical protein